MLSTTTHLTSFKYQTRLYISYQVLLYPLYPPPPPLFIQLIPSKIWLLLLATSTNIPLVVYSYDVGTERRTLRTLAVGGKRFQRRSSSRWLRNELRRNAARCEPDVHGCRSEDLAATCRSRQRRQRFAAPSSSRNNPDKNREVRAQRVMFPDVPLAACPVVLCLLSLLVEIISRGVQQLHSTRSTAAAI